MEEKGGGTGSSRMLPDMVVLSLHFGPGSPCLLLIEFNLEPSQMCIAFNSVYLDYRLYSAIEIMLMYRHDIYRTKSNLVIDLDLESFKAAGLKHSGHKFRCAGGAFVN